MTTVLLPGYMHPTMEVTERSEGHVLPFVVAVVIFLAVSVISIWATGMPH